MTGKKKTSLKRKMIIVLLIILISVVGIIKVSGFDQVLKAMWMSENTSKVKDFEKNEDSFQSLVDKIIKLRDEGIITEDNNSVYIEESKMYDSNYKEIKLTDAEKNSLSKIERTFDQDYPMEVIRIYDNYIAFEAAEYPFSVVYSKTGSRPNNLGLTNDAGRKYKIKNLAPKWYTVEEK